MDKSGLVETVTQLCTLFGVSEWDVGINFIDKPGGSDTWDAAVDLSSEYLQATIDIKPDLEVTPETIQLLAHEVMHIALAEYRAVTLEALNLLDGKKALKKYFMQRLDYTENRTIQRITRAVCSQVIVDDIN